MKLHTLPAGRQATKGILFCLLSGVLLTLSFPTTNYWFFAWFGFVPLLFALEKKSKGKAFLLAYLTGVIFWSGVVYWLIHVTLPGTILLILYLALCFGFFGIIITYAYLLPNTYCLLFIPCVWVLLEFIRSYLFTGFPWALLGYSQYRALPIIQIADITGVWGVSFLVMMVNAGIYSALSGKKKNLLPVICVIASLVYGYFRIHQTPPVVNYAPIRICVIQGNIPQELKWQSRTKSYILDKYTRLTEEAVSKAPDLIIWPEASSPGIFGEDDRVSQEIFSLSKKIKITLLIGTVLTEDEKYFNSALLIDANGQILKRYDKLHLVPFGEYIPLKKILPFLQTIVPIGDINRGQEYTVFALNKTSFSVLICFEDLFPELSRRFVKKGAQFLVNITNDAWYKETSAAEQHLQASVFRAVENHVFLVRSANTGISGFIAPTGKIISLFSDKSGKQIFVGGLAVEELNIPKKTFSFYRCCGDIFVSACFLFVLYVIISTLKKKK